MNGWTIIFEKRSLAEAKKLRRANQWKRVILLLDEIRANPFQNPPPFEKLKGEFDGMYSRRINIQHRLVYQVNKEERIVRVLQMWTHYE